MLTWGTNDEQRGVTGPRSWDRATAASKTGESGVPGVLDEGGIEPRTGPVA